LCYVISIAIEQIIKTSPKNSLFAILDKTFISISFIISFRKHKINNDKKLVYLAYFDKHIMKFVLENGCVPLNPYAVGYFLLDTVPRDIIREANNTLVKRADEIWVFGKISDGVLAEIKLANK
jgi:hypothetical protein